MHLNFLSFIFFFFVQANKYQKVEYFINWIVGFK